MIVSAVGSLTGTTRCAIHVSPGFESQPINVLPLSMILPQYTAGARLTGFTKEMVQKVKLSNSPIPPVKFSIPEHAKPLVQVQSNEPLKRPKLSCVPTVMLNVAVAPAPDQVPVQSPVSGVANAVVALRARAATEAKRRNDFLNDISGSFPESVSMVVTEIACASQVNR